MLRTKICWASVWASFTLHFVALKRKKTKDLDSIELIYCCCLIILFGGAYLLSFRACFKPKKRKRKKKIVNHDGRILSCFVAGRRLQLFQSFAKLRDRDEPRQQKWEQRNQFLVLACKGRNESRSSYKDVRAWRNRIGRGPYRRTGLLFDR